MCARVCVMAFTAKRGRQIHWQFCLKPGRIWQVDDSMVMIPKRGSYSLFVRHKGWNEKWRICVKLRNLNAVADTGVCGQQTWRWSAYEKLTWASVHLKMQLGKWVMLQCTCSSPLFISLHQFDLLWARRREYFTASVLLIWEVKNGVLIKQTQI